MKNIFNTVMLRKPKYSWFNLSHDHKLSLKMGYLVPVMTMDVMPGDVIKMSSEAMFRMMPLIAPIMHKVDVYMHCFFVPNRILWPNWERYIMGNEDGNPDPATPAFPTFSFDPGGSSQNVTPSSLANYLGIPVGPTTFNLSQNLSALPHLAYQRIYWDYYRDQNLLTGSPPVATDGATNSWSSLDILQKRSWEHDYFTSALPWAQKGEEVLLPVELTGDMMVESYSASTPNIYQPLVRDQDTGAPVGGGENLVTGAGGSFDTNVSGNAVYDPNGDLYVDGEEAQIATTINDLRTATALQRWLEKNARSGSRYVEGLLSFFNVRSSDARLQRAEYLGGSKANIAISEVLQTSQTTDETAQGNMAGHGIGISGGKDFQYRAEEHGYVICMLSIRPTTAYYQGIPKHFLKINDRFDFPWPDFAHLGEQPILNKELYYDDTDIPYGLGTFGYIPRYSEYRYMASRVSGQMATTLDFWHMARKFANQPVLNKAFIDSDPTTRIFAVEDPDEDTIVAHIYHKLFCRRPLPKYGVPGSIV